jgi:hypothetical protein
MTGVRGNLLNPTSPLNFLEPSQSISHTQSRQWIAVEVYHGKRKPAGELYSSFLVRKYYQLQRRVSNPEAREHRCIHTGPIQGEMSITNTL